MKRATKLPGGGRDEQPHRHHPNFDKVSALIGHRQLPRIDLPLEQYGLLHAQLFLQFYEGLRSPPPRAESLRKIHLSELQPDTIAKGCCIHGTIAATTRRIFTNAAALVLEDSTGVHACRLIFFNSAHTSLSEEQIHNKYPQGAKVVLKEPKLITVQGFLSEMQRVSMRTMLEALGEVFMVISHPEALEVLSYVPDVACRDSKSLKQLGNDKFRAGNFQAAAELYTRCLELTSSDEERLLALSNRAEANLQLHKLLEALADANLALEIDPTHHKSCSRKARALLGLHQYVDSSEWFNKAMEFSGPDEASKVAARASYGNSRRLKLQSLQGTHDLSGFIRSGFSKQHPEVFAEFVGPVEIRRSELPKGRGLFVTGDAHLGQLLLVSRAVITNCNGELECVSKLVEACQRAPRVRAQLYALQGCGETPDSKPPVSIDIFRPNTGVISGGEVLDVTRIESSWSRNQEIPSLGFVRHLSGLYPVTGFINYSCHPNVSFTEIGRTLFVFAARDLRAGEEIVRSDEDPMEPERCEEMGRYCERCSLLGSLGAPMNEMISRFRQAPNPGRRISSDDDRQGGIEALLGVVPMDPSEREYTRVALEVEKMLRSPPNPRWGEMSEEEKNWVRVSFCSAFRRAIPCWSRVCSGLPPALALIKAARSIVPGAPRLLRFICEMLWFCLRAEERAAGRAVAEEQCKASYGSDLIQKHPELLVEILRFHGAEIE